MLPLGGAAELQGPKAHLYSQLLTDKKQTVSQVLKLIKAVLIAPAPLYLG